MGSRREWGLPLFTKELQEQAVRRRTYVFRVAYVAMFLYFALLAIQQQISVVNPLNALGQGQRVLNSLVNFQFFGIFFLVPAMACDVLTVEKERNTLALLFLTRLGPWTIILEKLLSRLFPMMMVLMCALPIMAFSYSLGGLDPLQVYCAGAYLLLAAFQTACIAVMCSALSHSTASAFVKTYLVLLFMPIAALLFANLYHIPLQMLASFEPGLAQTIEWLRFTLFLDKQTIVFMFSPGALYSLVINNSRMYLMTPGTTFNPVQNAILLSLPSLLSGVICLYVARWALYRRAFMTPSNLLLKFFRVLDRNFLWANQKLAFNVKLVKESNTLPDQDPIAWREVSKRSLGQFRYLIRIMIPMLFPVIFLGAMIATSSVNDFRNRPMGSQNAGLTALICFLWVISLCLIAVTAANSIPLERTRQTWDVLRSTPLSGREILTQKLRGVQRLQWVCSIPLVTAIGLQTWWRFQVETMNAVPESFSYFKLYLNAFEYFLGAAGGTWVYSELIRWIALWCGLRIRNAMRAMIAALLLIAIAGVAPFLFAVQHFSFGPVARVFGSHHELVESLSAILAPGWFVYLNEYGRLKDVLFVPLVPTIAHLAVMGGLAFWLRRRLLRRADRYLERIGRPTALMLRTESDSSNPTSSIPGQGETLETASITGVT